MQGMSPQNIIPTRSAYTKNKEQGTRFVNCQGGAETNCDVSKENSKLVWVGGFMWVIRWFDFVSFLFQKESSKKSLFHFSFSKTFYWVTNFVAS